MSLKFTKSFFLFRNIHYYPSGFINVTKVVCKVKTFHLTSFNVTVVGNRNYV